MKPKIPPPTKTCRICHNELSDDWKWLEKPFYAKFQVVCPDCYTEKQAMINATIKSIGGKTK